MDTQLNRGILSMNNLLFTFNFVGYLLCWCHPEIFGFLQEHCYPMSGALGRAVDGTNSTDEFDWGMLD